MRQREIIWQCTKIYKNKKGLSKHIKTKHDKIGIKCDKCQFVVLTEKRLKEHMRKHERPIVKKPEKIKKLIPTVQYLISKDRISTFPQMSNFHL